MPASLFALPALPCPALPSSCDCACRKTRRSKQKTLVLDLDETLVHSTLDGYCRPGGVPLQQLPSGPCSPLPSAVLLAARLLLPGTLVHPASWYWRHSLQRQQLVHSSLPSALPCPT